LFLAAEGNQRLFQERVATAAESLGISTEGLPLFFAERPDPFRIGGPGLRRTIKDRRPGLIFLDTVGYFYDGDENSNTDWKRFVSKPLRRLAREYQTAFFLIQHLGKPNEIREGKHRIRGGSAQSGDSDSVFTLDKSKANPETDRVLSFEKIKNGPRMDPLVLRFDEPRAVFTLTETDALTAMKPALGEVQKILIEAGEDLRRIDLKARIMERLNRRETAADGLIDQAYSHGLISKPKRGVYGLPQAVLALAGSAEAETRLQVPSRPESDYPRYPHPYRGPGNPGNRPDLPAYPEVAREGDPGQGAAVETPGQPLGGVAAATNEAPAYSETPRGVPPGPADDLIGGQGPADGGWESFDAN
jgi:hypothetical protein